MEIQIECIEPGERIDELLKLFKINFKNWPPFSITCSPSEYYRWKYVDNVCGSGVVTVALDDDKIVGCIHSVMAKCKIGNYIFTSTYGSDALVDKGYRKRGIYGKISKFIEKIRIGKGVQFQYVSTHLKGMTPNPKTKTMPFNATNLVRINDINLHAKHRDISFIKRTGYSVMKLLKAKKRKQVDLSFDLLTNQEFRDPGFWEQIKDRYDFIIERDMNYLNWRYVDTPDKGYYVKQAIGDGQLLGYLVCKINAVNEEYPTGNIVDLLALPNRSDVVDVLVGSVVDIFDDNDVNLISVSMVENHEYRRILNEYGFVDTRQGNYLTYIPFDPISEQELVKINDNNRILFHYGDTDYN
jgi:hypothetical protein